MKDKLNLKQKLLVCWYWMTNHKDGILVHCGMCNSTELSIINSSKNQQSYTSEYVCNRCGAVAVNNETWQQDKKCSNAEKQPDGKCLGYSISESNDEPIEQCKNCKFNTLYEEC